MEELKQILLGTVSLSQIVGFGFWMLLAGITHMFYDYSERDVSSKATPEKLSLKFWWLDNWKRVVLNLLVTIIILRFSKQLFGDSMNAFMALIIGFNIEQIIAGLKKKMTSLGTDRAKFMQKKQNEA